MSSYYSHESAYIDDGATIGTGTKIWHYTHVMSTAQIGEHCNIGQNVFIGAGVVIDDHVKIQNNVSLYTGVICEDDVFIGPSAVFTNVVNPRSRIERKEEFRKTIVRKGASIGANVTIICGNEIGAYALIGAGAVITKTVRPHELWVGNPGKCIGWISNHGERLDFNSEGCAVCPVTKEIYQMMEDSTVVNVSA